LRRKLNKLFGKYGLFSTFRRVADDRKQAKGIVKGPMGERCPEIGEGPSSFCGLDDTVLGE